MRENDNIFVITADVGMYVLDPIKEEFPERFINVGAAENLMLGTAIGLAQEGKIPICYTITPFLIFTGFEFIRNYLYYENTKVILVGSGRDKDYDHDGFTHWAEDDSVLFHYPNIETVFPETRESIYFVLNKAIEASGPTYINLKRKI